MNLERLLVRCRAFERRAAAAYRAFAARTRHDPELCALWTEMARQEETHAEAIGRATGWLDATERWHTTLDGWEEALEEIEARLADAESRDIGADVDRQLLAALALERTELDTLFDKLLRLLPASERPHGLDQHTAGLLDVAARRGTSPAVAFEATLLRARNRLRCAS